MPSDWLVYTSSFPQTILLHLLHFVTMRVFGGFQMDSFCSNRCQRRGTLVLMPIWGHMGIGFFSPCIKSPQQSSSRSRLHSFPYLYPPKFPKIIESPLFTKALLLLYYFLKALHCCNSSQITKANLPQLYNHHNSGQSVPFVNSNHFCFWSRTEKNPKLKLICIYTRMYNFPCETTLRKAQLQMEVIAIINQKLKLFKSWN